MKTKAQWDEAGGSLTKFLQVGDVVDSEMAEYFYCVLPPAYATGDAVQMGEAWDHNANGEPRFLTLAKIDNVQSEWHRAWRYLGPRCRGRVTWHEAIDAGISAQYQIVTNGQHGVEVQKHGRQLRVFREWRDVLLNWNMAVAWCDEHYQSA